MLLGADVPIGQCRFGWMPDAGALQLNMRCCQILVKACMAVVLLTKRLYVTTDRLLTVFRPCHIGMLCTVTELAQRSGKDIETVKGKCQEVQALLRPILQATATAASGRPCSRLPVLQGGLLSAAQLQVADRLTCWCLASPHAHNHVQPS